MAVLMLLTLERPRMPYLLCFARCLISLLGIMYCTSIKSVDCCTLTGRYTMVLADNVDGGDDLDLIVTTMNGNVFCFSTQSPHHPLKVGNLFLQVFILL